MKTWRGFMAKYLPQGDVTDASYVFGFGITRTMAQVLPQCKGNFSRANVMRQAENLHDFEVAVLLPGIKLSTSHDRSPADQADADATLGRHDLEAVRRPDGQYGVRRARRPPDHPCPVPAVACGGATGFGAASGARDVPEALARLSRRIAARPRSATGDRPGVARPWGCCW